jgi:Calcium/calmodulin dependent protein kinase II Association.
MKFIMSLLAVTALSFVTSAFAQEESPSATPAENPSPTIEEKPSTTISEEPKAQKKEEPAAQKKEEPAAQKKEQPAAQKKVTNAAAAAPASGKKMSPDAALRDMENRWEDAIGKHDAATVEAMVADDFVGVSSKPGAKVQNRRAMLANMKADKDTYTSTKNEKLDVRIFGSGAAVVVGTAREKGTGKDGKAFDRAYRFTDTWVDRNGKWQCVASQASLVSGK